MPGWAWALVFLASAAVVIRSGLSLARAGDQLAQITGLGRMWVGTIFLAIATSLPELVTNISAVRLGAPALAGGNILGANMVNVVILVTLLSVFLHRPVLPLTKDQKALLVTALILTGSVPLFVGGGTAAALGPVSLGTLLILGGYLWGMRVVYQAQRQRLAPEPTDPQENLVPKSKAWLAFGLSALGIFLSAPALAASADRLAEILGISGGFMGALAVALVTTMPETSVTYGALRLAAEEMAFGNVYGSCAFNVAILGLADLFYPQPIFSALDQTHVVAGLGALFLMGLGPVFLLFRLRRKLVASIALALMIILGWIGIMYLMFSVSKMIPG